jgi:hypothetical protein
MIIGISGQAGTGKDAVASFIVEHYNFVCVAIADPIKRIVKEVFKFSDEQLWGPSFKRNLPDTRYPRSGDVAKKARDFYCANEELGLYINKYINLSKQKELEQAAYDGWVTPRLALQKFGTSGGRECYDDIWVEYAIDVADKIQIGNVSYTPQGGLVEGYRSPPRSVVFSDARFINELDGIRKAKAKLVRVYRPNSGLVGAAGAHRSESEQKEIKDDYFDYILNNFGTIEDLKKSIVAMMIQITAL